MHRRTFIKTAALSAIALSTFGYIHFDGEKFVGDCETTTDILGPFYMPGSPVRSNLIIEGEAGTPVELTGFIKHNDCLTPYSKAKIELWHCDNEGKYDLSKEYRHRGTTFSDKDGKYAFHTIMPVPYTVGDGNIRPAHFHLIISAPGYQSLITQLYFSGDRYIKTDPYASSPRAERRILTADTLGDGTKRVTYNVSMAEILPVEPPSLEKLTGLYTGVDSWYKETEFFINDNTIWMKNGVYGDRFDYIGDNTFEYPGMPEGMLWKLKFEPQANGDIKLTITSTDNNLNIRRSVYLKSSNPPKQETKGSNFKW